ncbi:uncharacterized protein LOC126327401 [Schistocerca gregaria]|uniref:uncharacterized protein LOC126327401 n=1 Tax=Schistocerca gregaria TaxID=7010 RepID=UPI00211F361D|nr:uncharacterized protein LOC126327401 [Schistocerca gregaria]
MTAAVALAKAASTTTGMEEPESGGPEHEGEQTSSGRAWAAGQVPQCVQGSAVDDERQESPPNATQTPQCETDSLLSERSYAEKQSVCSQAKSNYCKSEVNTCHSCSSVAIRLPQIDNQNQQSLGCCEEGEVPEASGEEASHSAENRETSGADGESGVTSVMKKSGGGRSRSSSRGSSRSSSTSRGSADGQSYCCSGNGADSDDDTDTGLSETSSLDLAELYDDTIDALEAEAKKEERIMEEIGNCMEVVCAMNSDIRVFVLEMFGTQRLMGYSSRKCSGGRRKGKRSDVEEETTRGPIVDFERRLDAVKAYLNKRLDESPREAEEKANAVSLPEEGACSATPSNAKQEAENSSSGAGVGCSEDVPTAVSSGNNECGDTEADPSRQQSCDGNVRKRMVARESWEVSVVAKICSIVEKRVLRVKVGCQMMLSSMQAVANTVKLAMEAYEATQLVVHRAKKCKSVIAADILRAIVAAATETTAWMLKALSDVEAAVAIHAEIVGAIEKAERTLRGGQGEDRVDEGVEREVTATVDNTELLTRCTARLRLRPPRGEDRAVGSASDMPPPGSGEVKAIPLLSAKVSGGTDRLPADVLHALLVATRSALKAMEATERALDFFTACEMCVGGKFRKRRGYGNKMLN